MSDHSRHLHGPDPTWKCESLRFRMELGHSATTSSPSDQEIVETTWFHEMIKMSVFNIVGPTIHLLPPTGKVGKGWLAELLDNPLYLKKVQSCQCPNYPFLLDTTQTTASLYSRHIGSASHWALSAVIPVGLVTPY